MNTLIKACLSVGLLICWPLANAQSLNSQTMNTALASGTYPLQRGQTVIGLDGGSVTAPAVWRAGPTAGVTITIERLDPQTLEYPIDPRFRLGLPVYRVQASQLIWTGNRGRFKVSLPIGRANPAFLFPERLSDLIADQDGDDNELTTWVSDDAAEVNAQNIVFETAGFTDTIHLFTAVLLDEPRKLKTRP